MPYTKTLEEGLKLFDAFIENKIHEGIDWQDWRNDYSDSIKLFLTTFAEKIRESVVGDIEKKLNGLGYGNRNSGMAIGYDHAIKDVLFIIFNLKDK